MAYSHILCAQWVCLHVYVYPTGRSYMCFLVSIPSWPVAHHPPTPPHPGGTLSSSVHIWSLRAQNCGLQHAVACVSTYSLAAIPCGQGAMRKALHQLSPLGTPMEFINIGRKCIISNVQNNPRWDSISNLWHHVSGIYSLGKKDSCRCTSMRMLNSSTLSHVDWFPDERHLQLMRLLLLPAPIWHIWSAQPCYYTKH